MIPTLYDPTETNFNHNGVGLLTDAVSCKPTEELNGAYELHMRYPVKGIHFKDIEKRSIIKATANQEDGPQLFRVYNISKPLNGIVSIDAAHISYDMSGLPVSPFEASGVVLALQGLESHSVYDSPFSFYTDKSAQGVYKLPVPASMRSCLGGNDRSLLSMYGGEWHFDNFKVSLLNHRGANRGVVVRYGKNLTNFKQDENCQSVFTGVYPYWTNDEGNLVELPEKIVKAPGTYNFENARILDLSQEFDGAPTVEQLRERAERFVRENKIGIPKVSMTIEFEQLEKYEGTSKLLERVLLGDELTVIFPEMNVKTTARAVKYTYDTLLNKVDKITIGSVRATIADKIVEQDNAIENIPKPNLPQIEQSIKDITATLLGASGGAVRLLDTNSDGKPDTLYIADNENPDEAMRVWRYNYEGWGASKTGYAGPYVMGATLNDGMVADFITAGTLNANLIKAGVIQALNGNFRLNLETGEIFVGGYATETDVNGLQSGLDHNSAEIGGVKDSVSGLQQQTGGLSNQVQNIVDNGVDKVITTTGYRFDADGLKIRRSGEEIENRIDNTGMYVTRSGETMLQANAAGVVAADVTVKNYLIVGDHARFEKYKHSDGTEAVACYWV